ncbi:MAG: hypothetical protein KatS3mg031_0506 [Chitinophagales bacterium]|nr:MAG: hypothetical protein KatS3mg031_0506 [Chitinophagales bacterium]
MRNLFAIAITLILMSCNQQSSENTDASTGTTQEPPAATQTETPASATPAENPPHGAPGHVHEESESGGMQNTGTTAKLNPPHGEPGHRCDIPVGAPLPE